MRRLVVILLLVCAGCANRTGTMATIGPSYVKPLVIQTGNSPTNWESFPTAHYANQIITGPDNQIWYATSDHFIDRFNLATNTVDSVDVGFTANALATGPDGNVWTCGTPGGQTTQIAKITPGLQVTTYTAPLCDAIASYNGALWVTSYRSCELAQVSIAGVVTDYPLPACPQSPTEMAIGADGNLWFLQDSIDNKVHSIVRFVVATQTFTQFNLPPHNSLGGLKLGSDGYLYSCRRRDNGFSAMNRTSMAGAMTMFPVANDCAHVSNSGPPTAVLFVSQLGQQIESMAVRSRHVDVYGAPPNGDLMQTVTLGPDLNVWGGSNVHALDVYIKRVLSVAPSSATISVGQSAPFTIAETNCSCVWTARSSDQSVATVSGVSGKSFTVTAVGVGTATIRVADQKQNYFDVLIQTQ
jgi:hypothetical protein